MTSPVPERRSYEMVGASDVRPYEIPLSHGVWQAATCGVGSPSEIHMSPVRTIGRMGYRTHPPRTRPRPVAVARSAGRIFWCVALGSYAGAAVCFGVADLSADPSADCLAFYNCCPSASLVRWLPPALGRQVETRTDDDVIF